MFVPKTKANCYCGEKCRYRWNYKNHAAKYRPRSLDHLERLRRLKDSGNRLCSKCKAVKSISAFGMSGRFLSRTCKQCGIATLKKWSCGPGRYVTAIKTAARRGFDWSIPEHKYVLFVSHPCFYCGGPLCEAGVGLDRVHNHIGYHENNVVPCCGCCNVTRGDRFSFEEMCGHIGPAIRAVREKRSGGLKLAAM